jgi:transcriptional regulator with XRE-family HTH domain
MMMRSSFKANTESPRQGRVGRFGDKFRKEREKKEISLDDVSRVTKISSRMLQAIEEEQFDRLPGGVFNKGFIRAYAKHLGLNDEEAISEYLTCLHQEQIDAQSSWQPSSREGAPAKRPIVPPPSPRRKIRNRRCSRRLRPKLLRRSRLHKIMWNCRSCNFLAPKIFVRSGRLTFILVKVVKAECLAESSSRPPSFSCC